MNGMKDMEADFLRSDQRTADTDFIAADREAKDKELLRMDLHMHSTFCDGKSTPEEMIEAALALGYKTVGVCIHSHTPFDESYCASIAGMRDFRTEMERLKLKYADRIRVLAGVEQDLYADGDTAGFNYVIGSVHYLKVGEDYFAVDVSEEGFRKLAEEKFGGDYLLLAEHFYEQASCVAEATNADVIGHLDLVSKFNEGGKYFDENDPRYLSAAKKCIDRLISYGKPFEINTGPVSYGRRSGPYPSETLRKYIREKGGSFIVSSDAHSAEVLLRDSGLHEAWFDYISSM